jgi:hypothetical protein
MPPVPYKTSSGALLRIARCGLDPFGSQYNESVATVENIFFQKLGGFMSSSKKDRLEGLAFAKNGQLRKKYVFPKSVF